jgi:hypothetical protein
MTKLPFNRPVAAIVLLTFCVSVGCSNVRTVGVEQLSPDEAESLVGKNVRLYTDDGVKTITVEAVDYPYVVGIQKDRSRAHSSSQTDETVQIRLDLREVQKVEIVDPPTWGTAFVVAARGLIAISCILLAVAVLQEVAQ